MQLAQLEQISDLSVGCTRKWFECEYGYRLLTISSNTDCLVAIDPQNRPSVMLRNPGLNEFPHLLWPPLYPEKLGRLHCEADDTFS